MDAQTLKRLVDLAFYVGLALLVTGVIAIGEINYTSRVEQRELLMRFNTLDSALLRAAELVPGHEPLADEVCLTIKDPIELRELAAFLSRADDTYYGGHQSSQFRFKLYLDFSEGEQNRYLIRTFERSPSDIFLNVVSYEIHDNSSYTMSIVVPDIRIPDLYPWLHDRAVAAGCSIK